MAFRLIVLACVLSVCQGAPRVVPSRSSVESRNVGGVQASIVDIPYQISVEHNQYHKCGGTIISANWALTTAACVDGGDLSSIRLRSDTSYRQNGGKLHAPLQIIVHPDYDWYTTDYDIALVHVGTTFAHRGVRLSDTEPGVGSVATASGWGVYMYGFETLPSQLRSVRIPVISRSTCNSMYSKFGGVTDRMICTLSRIEEADTCQGDGGGPITVDGILVGLSSWGVGCGFPKFPGVHTNVAFFRDWVREISGV